MIEVVLLATIMGVLLAALFMSFDDAAGQRLLADTSYATATALNVGTVQPYYIVRRHRE